MAALFQRAEDEGWKIADVAEAAGVAYGTATWWKRKLRESGQLATTRTKFVEAVPVDRIDVDHGTGFSVCVVKCELPNGMRVEIEADVHDAAALLKSLAC